MTAEPGSSLARRLALVCLQRAVDENLDSVDVDAEQVAREALAADAPREAAFAWFLWASQRRLRAPDEARTACDAGGRLLRELPLGPLHVRHAMLEHALDVDAAPDHRDVRPLKRIAAMASRAGAPWLESHVLVNLAFRYGHGSEHAAQRDAARRALELAQAFDQPLVARRALGMLASALTSLGPLDEAARHIDDLLASPSLQPPLALETHLAGAAVAFARGDLDAVETHAVRARSLVPYARIAWLASVADFWDALAQWAHWGDLEQARRRLERVDAEVGGITPDLIRSRWLAVRAHTDPSDEVAAAFDALEAELEARRLPHEHLAVDRAHLALAEARRAAEGGEAPEAVAEVEAQLAGSLAVADSGFHVVCSRVLLAAAYAELQHDVWEAGGNTR